MLRIDVCGCRSEKVKKKHFFNGLLTLHTVNASVSCLASDWLRCAVTWRGVRVAFSRSPGAIKFSAEPVTSSLVQNDWHDSAVLSCRPRYRSGPAQRVASLRWCRRDPSLLPQLPEKASGRSGLNTSARAGFLATVPVRRVLAMRLERAGPD